MNDKMLEVRLGVLELVVAAMLAERDRPTNEQPSSEKTLRVALGTMKTRWVAEESPVRADEIIGTYPALRSLSEAVRRAGDELER